MPERDVKTVALSRGRIFIWSIVAFSGITCNINVFLLYRLIKHTEKLLEEKEEKLCVKVLRTLREMMAIDPEYGEKVSIMGLYFA